MGVPRSLTPAANFALVAGMALSPSEQCCCRDAHLRCDRLERAETHEQWGDVVQRGGGIAGTRAQR